MERRVEEILTNIQTLTPGEGKVGSQQEESLADVSHARIRIVNLDQQ